MNLQKEYERNADKLFEAFAKFKEDQEADE